MSAIEETLALHIRAENLLMADCKICGKQYKQSRSNQIYCSSVCGQAAWRSREYKYTYLTCPHCKQEFKRLHSKQKYCSKDCAMQAEKIRRKVVGGAGKGWSKGMEFADKTQNYVCLDCGKPFYALVSPSYKSRGGGKFCSNDCRVRAIANNPSAYPQTTCKRSNIGKRADLDGMFFRSSWEANYARYLNFLIKAKEIVRWEFEVDTFEFHAIKKGTRFYTPDFKVFKTETEFEYHEIKGYMDSKSATKLKRMKKYYPDVKVVLIDKKGYAAIAKVACKLVSGWEGNYGCK